LRSGRVQQASGEHQDQLRGPPSRMPGPRQLHCCSAAGRRSLAE
jgi:hypothetical protein